MINRLLEADHHAIGTFPEKKSSETRELDVLALVKDTERYIFLCDTDSRDKLLQTLGEFAGDKDLSFTWYDAAVLSQKVRKLKEEEEQEHWDGWNAEDNG